MPRRRTVRDRINPLAHAVTWFYCLLLLAPLYYLLVSAFKDNLSIFNSPFALPHTLSFGQFSRAWGNADLGSALVNSILVTAWAEVLTLLLALPASYALARSRSRLTPWVERFFALGFLIPGFAALVPTVLLAIQLHLFQTRTFLVLLFPAGALPLSVILLTQFMRAVPSELAESAVVDGAGPTTILWRIYAPLAMPGIVTVMILNFLSFWNEYLFSLTIAGPDPAVRTIQVALPTLVSETNTQYGVLMAGALITMLPVYVVYVVLQRRMSDALIDGAVKS